MEVRFNKRHYFTELYPLLLITLSILVSFFAKINYRDEFSLRLFSPESSSSFSRYLHREWNKALTLQHSLFKFQVKRWMNLTQNCSIQSCLKSIKTIIVVATQFLIHPFSRPLIISINKLCKNLFVLLITKQGGYRQIHLRKINIQNTNTLSIVYLLGSIPSFDVSNVGGYCM